MHSATMNSRSSGDTRNGHTVTTTNTIQNSSFNRNLDTPTIMMKNSGVPGMTATATASVPATTRTTNTTKTTATTTNSNAVNQAQSFNSSEEDVVTERRYGCYRFGMLVAAIIILILLAGIVPVMLSIDNRQIILLVTCITLVIVAIMVFVYVGWQHRTARRQRQKFGREWVTTTNRHVGFE